jgi:hypothetical protein
MTWAPGNVKNAAMGHTTTHPSVVWLPHCGRYMNLGAAGQIKIDGDTVTALGMRWTCRECVRVLRGELGRVGQQIEVK